jgi:transcriptional regulator with XRE-family HTH domain
MGGPGSGARRLRVRTDDPPPDDVLDRLPNAIAAKVFAMRTLLGLSQEQLAHKAHISQGAVSRMESGECGAMPLRTIGSVFLALVVELAPMGQSCAEEVRALIQAVTGILPMAVENKGFTVLQDAGLDAVVRGYAQLEEPDRAVLVTVLDLLLKRRG